MDETNQLNNISLDQTSELTFIEEIKPIEIPDPYGWVLPTIIAIVFVLLLFAGYIWWKNLSRKRAKDGAITVSPYEKAMLRLRKAMSLESDPRVFVSEVSNTLRVYLEEQFSIAAPEQTTEEFLDFLKKDNTLHPNHKLVLNEFLKTADLVKFAKFEPGKNELLKLFDTAKDFIDQTGHLDESKELDSQSKVVEEGSGE